MKRNPFILGLCLTALPALVHAAPRSPTSPTSPQTLPGRDPITVPTFPGSPIDPGDGGPVGRDDEPDPTGCPYDYYPEDEWFADETKFAFPIENPVGKIAPEPFQTHMDRERGTHAEDDPLWACSDFAGGNLCYKDHEGTDYPLLGSFLQMDHSDVWAIAAAPGVVMERVDHHFDRCSVDTNPGGFESVANPNAGQWNCEGLICFLEPPVIIEWVDNPTFLDVICDDGVGPVEIEGLDENYVQMCHRDGTISAYRHLMEDSIPAGIQPGAEVSCGTRLGLVGSSGHSAGPHLHFDVQQYDDYAQDWVWVDPYEADPADGMWTQQNEGFGSIPGPVCMP